LGVRYGAGYMVGESVRWKSGMDMQFNTSKASAALLAVATAAKAEWDDLVKRRPSMVAG
jgi:hypothetical protein